MKYRKPGAVKNENGGFVFISKPPFYVFFILL